MCGIFGALATDSDRPVPGELFDRMGRTLFHRGPDEGGDFRSDDVAIGVRRLAIVDPQEGHQPLVSEDGVIRLVCNGEIYNHLDLRRELSARHTFRTHSDLEVLVHLYEELGLDFLTRVEGMFGVALWDGRERRLVLARDRMGEKPLFYGAVQGTTWFASELRALGQVPGLCAEVDGAALRTYLSLGYFPAPTTPWRGVRKLAPGTMLVMRPRGGEATPRRWWSLRDHVIAGLRQPTDQTEAAATVTLREQITGSVQRQLRADAPVGVALSGGLDSGLVTVLAARYMEQPVSAFTVSFSDQSYDELDAARALVKETKARHVIIPATHEALIGALDGVARHMDEPLGDPAVLPTWLLVHEASKSVRVLLSGEGADELFGGYPTYFGAGASDAYARWPKWLTESVIRPLVNAFPRSEKKVPLDLLLRKFVDHARLPTVRRHLAWFYPISEERAGALAGPRLREPGRDVGAMVPLQIMDRLLGDPADWGPLDPTALMYLDARTYLGEGLLTKLDRIAMSASVESRAPFLGRDIVEMSTRLPLAWRAAGVNGKKILREAARPLVPPALLKRRKRGLSVPLATLFRHELRARLRDTLNSTDLNAEGLLDGAAVEALLARHLDGRADESRALWHVLMLVSWHRAFGRGAGEGVAAPGVRAAADTPVGAVLSGI